MPKATSSRAAAARRHNPLAEDITSAGQLRAQSNKKGKSRSQGEEEGEGENGQRFIDAKMSRKILQIGQELADEDEAETKRAMGAGQTMPNPAFDFDARLDEQEMEALSDDENANYENDEWLDEDVENAVREIVYANGLDMRQTLMLVCRRLIPMISTCSISSCQATMKKIRSSTPETPMLLARLPTLPT